MIHWWWTEGAWVSCLIYLNPLLSKNIAHDGSFQHFCVCLCLCIFLCLVMLHRISKSLNEDFHLESFLLSLFLYLSLCVYLSLYLSLMLLKHCQDDILTENIWFIWSKTSHSGDKWRCYRCGTDGRRRTDAGRWVLQYVIKRNQSIRKSSQI